MSAPNIGLESQLLLCIKEAARSGMAERLEDDALWRFLDIHLQTEGRVPSLGLHRRVDDIPMLVDVRKPMGLRPGP